MIKKLSGFLVILSVVVFNSDIFLFKPVMAAGNLDVVINEIAWAGSADNALDEWIELYNNTGTTIDITNWKIEDDGGAQLYTLSGTIPAHGYFLLESRETATSISADQVRSLSLSNGGDSEILKDNNNNVIDTVNSGSVAWFAGSATSHATMERISTTTSGDISSNWQSSAGGSISTSSNGTTILGTPKASNSGTVIEPQITLSPDQSTISPDQQITFTIAVNNVHDLSNYGFDINYDAAKLQYVGSTERSFLSENGTVETSFQSGLENGDEGVIVIGNARTTSPQTGISGQGELFTLIFAVQAGATGASAVTLTDTSFLSSPSGNITVSTWPSTSFTIEETSEVSAVTNLQTIPGTDRYSIALQWSAVSGTNINYQVYRRNPHGVFDLIGTSTAPSFIDHDGITDGGNIIPGFTYEYQVISTSGSQESTPTSATGIDNRGLMGDNNRSDRVDGHDLENIAKAWTVDDSQANFPTLVDTSFDGTIGGNDLIDLAITWAKTYP